MPTLVNSRIPLISLMGTSISTCNLSHARTYAHKQTHNNTYQYIHIYIDTFKFTSLFRTASRSPSPEAFERGVSWGTALRARVKQLFSASRAGEGQPGGRLQARQEHRLTSGGRQGAGRGGGGG